MTDSLPEKVHFIGVGGVGMAGLAFLLKRKGHIVTGCDKYASARTRWLEDEGIPVAIGHSPDHLAGVDAVVATPAVPRDEPEFAAAGAVRWRGNLLAELVNSSDGVAVCGTHGKTTTATFTAKLLRALGDNPSWCIGGETGSMPVAGDGTGPFVVEADESDGTLARYAARTLVVTSIDFDHPEHFKGAAEYRACYDAAIAAAGDVVKSWELDPSDWPELDKLVVGRHNVVNARAAIEVALRRGHTREEIASALPYALSELPDRRFEMVHPPSASPRSADFADAFAVVTDYAHHPAELSCAMSMARDLGPRRLRVLFQPHRHSRTSALLNEFPSAFAAADEVVLLPVYSAFEKPIPGGDIADLYAAFRRRQMESGLWPEGLILARSPLEAWRHVHLTVRPGDLVLLAGAGDIVGILPKVREDCAAPLPAEPRRFTPLAPLSFFRTGGATCGGGRRIVVGQGSNTWFSDCADDCEIVRPPLPSGSSFGIPWMAGIPGTIGGWAKMNAGAFGHSISERIESVTVERDDGSRETIPAAACGFGYRTSSIPGTIVDVKLKPPPVEDEGAAADYLARRKRFPPRTCGSVFKNPPCGKTAGELLDAAGAKTLAVGGARVWEEHANVIKTEEDATSSDVLALARLMARAVQFKFGVALQPEISGIVV
jgi:UDP-N-acetylmuramate-alanine ligase